jgi:ribonuclease J
VYAPEAEDLLDEACDAVAAAVERTLAGACATSSRSSATCAALLVASSTSAPPRPMIVPVVMEA